VRRVGCVPASAQLVRREAADAAGRLGGDPIEFCRRLRRAGWRVLHVRDARAVAHNGDADADADARG
jgi:GT2 family glycosyltransferase